MIYAGDGIQRPDGDSALFIGRVFHDQLPVFLSAADFFVLPTLLEGCSNAIIEAMACGLPVISSLGGFNDDILDDANSIRIDPMDTEELREAMRRMVFDVALREKMGRASLSKAKTLDITKRAERIVGFMNAKTC